MNFNDDYHQLDNQIKIIMRTYFSNYIEKYDYYNFRCNVCGDSKKSKYKKRGYILKRKRPWTYFCHNCGCNIPVYMWMKEYFPSEYRDYIKHVLDNTYSDDKEEVIECDTKLRIVYNEKDDVKFFVPISKAIGKRAELAKKFCISRFIPEEIWSKWFVATDGLYKNRIIIPFFDDKNKIHFYQGRSLYSNMSPKYLSRKDVEGKYCSTYNIYNVDKTKPVIILEGPVDSIFIDNSVAVTGLKVGDESLKTIKYKYYLLDNDASGRKKSLELLKKGEYVFNWKNFSDCKDINEMIIKQNKFTKFCFKDLEKYFTNNSYDKIWFV